VPPKTPLMFTATLFHPPVSCTSLSWRPSQGLQDSSNGVQQILKAKRVRCLSINTDGLSAPSHASRQPISVIPAYAYGAQDIPGPELSLQTNVAPWEQDMALTPIEMDLGALEFIANLPESAHPSRNKSVVKALSRKLTYHGSLRNSIVPVELSGGSLMTVIAPEQSAWQRAYYVPGEIRIETKAKQERLPLEIIQETVNAELGLDKETRMVEQAMLDELVSFIESFGDEFVVEDTGIDAFWLDSPSVPPLKPNKGYLSPPLSHTSTLIASPPATSVPRLSLQDQKVPRSSFDASGDVHEDEFIRELPLMSLKRASLASSQHSGSSRTMMSTPNSLTTYSPPPKTHPYRAPSPMQSPGTSNLGTPVFTMSPRKVRQIKGKGPTSGGRRISLRGLIRSAASIV
jgi:hypothetical protein